jgi:hypothetical protein
MKVRTQVQGGKIMRNHSDALRVRTTLRAGRRDKLATNHNKTLRVRTTLRGGRIAKNHNER